MKRVLITGANKGIGLATAAAILERHHDAQVVLGSRDAARGEEALADLCRRDASWSSRVILLPLDVASDDSVNGAREQFLATAGEEPQPLYGLVNNAGIGLVSSDMARVIDVNTLGPKRVCDAFAPLVAPGGRIVNLSSASAPNFVSRCSPARQAFFQESTIEWRQIEDLLGAVLRLGDDEQGLRELGLGEFNPYGFSKACLSLYTLLLARQYPALYVNACTPGYIETDLTRPRAEAQGVAPADLGMKDPQAGTVATLSLLFGSPDGSGHYYGSDALRSPMDRYRAPGSPAFNGN